MTGVWLLTRAHTGSVLSLTSATRALLGSHQSMLEMAYRRRMWEVLLLQKVYQGWGSCESQHGWRGAGKRLNLRCGWGQRSVRGCSWRMWSNWNSIRNAQLKKQGKEVLEEKEPPIHEEAAITDASIDLGLPQCLKVVCKRWCSVVLPIARSVAGEK